MHYMRKVPLLETRRDPLAVASLLAATAAWGATFVVVKGVIAHMNVESFLAWRFLLAGALLAALRPRALANLSAADWGRGLALGLALAGGYELQTIGLRTTPAAVSGALTSLQVVFAPLLAWALTRQAPRSTVWLAAVLATAGSSLVSLPGLASGDGHAGGEMLTLASAAAFALQVVGLGRWSTGANAYGLATLQLLTVAATSLLGTLPAGPGLPPGGAIWAGVATTAVLATAVPFAVQSWAQSRLSTWRASVILGLEPVFAALAAAAAGEPLGWAVLTGGAIVVAALMLVEVPSLPRLPSIRRAWRARPAVRNTPSATKLSAVPKRERVLAVAHRGDPVGQRENTLEAFMSAKALGAATVELDCRLTRDGEVVVLHDPTLERLWGVHKAVSELDWADVSRIQHGCYRIPLFAEVLDATDLPIMVDLPEASAAVPSYNLALAAGAVGRCYFAGNLAGLCEVRNRSASANIALTWDKPELPNQQLISALKPQWWNPYHWLASPRAVEWAHSSGMAVSTWTVDSARDIKRALAAGVDAVISNQVALLVSHLKPAG